MRTTKQSPKPEQGSPLAKRGLYLFLAILVMLGLAVVLYELFGPADQTGTTAEPTPTPLVVTYTEGVTVTVPWQGREVQVEPVEPTAPCTQDSKCNRIVIDFKLVEKDPGTGQERTMTECLAPINVKVAYKASDVSDAGGRDWLTLLYWDQEQWIAFTKEDHCLDLTGDRESGDGSIWICSWGDRAIAWGD